MSYKTVLESWLHNKLSVNQQYQLQETWQQKEVFRRMGVDTSNFAYVSFKCEPSAEFTLNWKEEWPNAVGPMETEKLHVAINSGVLDAMFSADYYPYSGCSLTLTKVLWDEAGSSQVAFYMAARLAMQELISQRSWQLVPRRGG